MAGILFRTRGQRGLGGPVAEALNSSVSSLLGKWREGDEEALRELLPLLAKYKVGARLILRGVRRNGQRLVLTHTKRSSARQP